jgi:hypothetical protein
MVETAFVLSKENVETVVQKQGNVTIEAVKRTFSRGEMEYLARRALTDQGVKTIVIADLDRIERERVEEAAEAEGKEPGEWLAEATEEIAREKAGLGEHISVERQIEEAILNKTEV